MPFAFIFLLFVFLEIAGFVAMAEAVGLFGVFGLVLLGIFAGGFVIRTIGLASVQRMQERSERGETVGQELGGLVLGFLGGLLLIVPGFLTDIVGILFLIKPVQMLIWPRYGRQMASQMPDVSQGASWRSPGRPGQSPQRDAQAETVIIDAEVEPDGPSTRRTTRDDNPWGT